jgi:helicase MOV-10
VTINICGTVGKTSTVAEAILRICLQYPTKRILACAPSEAAADVLCERLSRHLNRAQLFRLNWWQRTSASVPARLRPFCYDVNDVFEMPSPHVFLLHRVVVCTCGTAGAIKTLPLPQQVAFDVVFVDEASQAVEPEVRTSVELIYVPLCNAIFACICAWTWLVFLA